jgi:elongation factor Ts
VRTETDFTARNESFVKMVEGVAGEAMSFPAGPVSANDQITKMIDEVRITTGENANFTRGEKLEGGHFGSYVHHDGKRACLLQVEGDAGADLLKGICQHIVFHDPMGISEKDVPADQLQQVRDDAIAEAKESGKPEEIAGKIAEGKVRKYLEERTLINQKYVLDESKTVKEVLPSGVTIKKFIRYTLGG